MNDKEYRLYVFVKTNMDSMTRGRIAAQTNHAGSAFNHAMLGAKTTNIYPHFIGWATETEQNFGTTIVLDGLSLLYTLDEIKHFPWNDPIFYQEIVDPSYCIEDGYERFFVPVTTCLNLFASKNDWDNFCNKHPRHQLLI